MLGMCSVSILAEDGTGCIWGKSEIDTKDVVHATGSAGLSRALVLDWIVFNDECECMAVAAVLMSKTGDVGIAFPVLAELAEEKAGGGRATVGEGGSWKVEEDVEELKRVSSGVDGAVKVTWM